MRVSHIAIVAAIFSQIWDTSISPFYKLGMWDDREEWIDIASSQ